MTVLIKVIIDIETVLISVINRSLALRQTVSRLIYGECEPEAFCMKFQEYSRGSSPPRGGRSETYDSLWACHAIFLPVRGTI